jgi:hypothetical protein
MTKIIVYAAIAIAVLGAIGVYSAKLYNDGIQAERQAQLTKAVKLVKERDALNVKVKTATPADICSRLGGKWLPDTNECG